MDVNFYKNKLEEEKALLEKELSSLGIKDPDTGDWGAILPQADRSDISDPNDMADRDEDFTITANTLGELEIRYNEILRALAKIETGNFGTCEISGTPIEEDRLQANPAARTCKAHMNEENNLTQ
jgi:RNA polymerase-binding transcription factor DksA